VKYFRNWTNFSEWYFYNGRKIFICKWCGGKILDPQSENQKYHQRDESPECCDDRYFDGLWEKGKHPLQIKKPTGT